MNTNDLHFIRTIQKFSVSPHM